MRAQRKVMVVGTTHSFVKLKQIKAAVSAGGIKFERPRSSTIKSGHICCNWPMHSPSSNLQTSPKAAASRLSPRAVKPWPHNRSTIAWILSNVVTTLPWWHEKHQCLLSRRQRCTEMLRRCLSWWDIAKRSAYILVTLWLLLYLEAAQNWKLY